MQRKFLFTTFRGGGGGGGGLPNTVTRKRVPEPANTTGRPVPVVLFKTPSSPNLPPSLFTRDDAVVVVSGKVTNVELTLRGLAFVLLLYGGGFDELLSL